MAEDLEWLSLAGSGLVSLPNTRTLAPGRWHVGGGFDNRDRDPLKMDVLDLAAAWTFGVASRLETYGHLVVSRAVTVSPRDALFPSPLDLVLAEGVPLPQRPYYPIYSAFPYLSRNRGASRITRFNPGEAVLGAKRTLWTAREGRPGLAVSGELKLPLTRALPDLQGGSGTGGFDQRVRLTAEWRARRRSFLGSVAYTHMGNGAWGDRVIVYKPSGGAAVTEQPLVLAGNVVFGAGFREVLTPRVSLIAEITKLMEVGGRTRAFRVPGPVDATAGAVVRWRNLRATLGLRYHANSVDRRHYDWPLAGFADLGDVTDEHRVAYLQSIGAASVLSHLRRGSQTALALPANAPPLPPGGRIIPPGFTMGPHGELAYVAFVTWAPDSKR